MRPTLPNLRYEKKFVAEGLTLAEVLARVQRHPAAFREAFPPRLVNNIYLDSLTRRDYHDHINGVGARSKTRVRWYGPHLEVSERPSLERKFKRGAVSGKEAYVLPRLAMQGGCLRSLLNTAFDGADFPASLRCTLRHLEPALFNRYQRHYFLSRDAKFRLTVDSRLQFAGVRLNARPTPFALPAAPTVIIELKFGVHVAADAGCVTNAFPFRVVRFSKYVEGIERL